MHSCLNSPWNYCLTLLSYASPTRLDRMFYISRSTFRTSSNQRSSTISSLRDSPSRHRPGMLACFPFRLFVPTSFSHHAQSWRSSHLRVPHRLLQGNSTRGTLSIAHLSVWSDILFPLALGFSKASHVTLPRRPSS